jgi:hypothetical protein
LEDIVDGDPEYQSWRAACTLRALEPELRTVFFRATGLERERAQARCHAVEHGRLEPSLLEQVVDGDPEYQSWVAGTLCPAVDALVNEPAEEKERPSTVVKLPRTRRRWAALAAAAVLALVSGLSWYVYRLERQLSATHGRVAELERRGAEQNTQIEEEVRRRKAAEDDSGRLGSLLRTAQEGLSATGDQLASVERELRQALDFGAAVNVRKLVFGGTARFSRGGSRGEAVVLEQGTRSSPLTYLEVEVVDPEPYQTYRLRLVPIKGGKPVAVDGLRRDGAWLRLGLSPDQLTSGEYEVRIDGMRSDSPVELDERYQLIVTS